MITEVVGERSRQRGSHTVRSGGASGSENAGVSSEMQVRILHTDRPRFPGEGSSALGKSGPKARPKGVVDGQLVDIPVLDMIVMEGRSRLTKACDWKCTSKQ